MCETIPLLCSHLLENNFKYVLTGKFQSDSLEGRFSWYRQLLGGNYYLSVKQILDNKRKIKVVSLLQHCKILIFDLKEMKSYWTDIASYQRFTFDEFGDICRY